MARSKMWALAGAASALALVLTACSSPSGTPAPGGGGEKIKIGIKFDQPGLGVQEGNTFTGFDVEVAKYVAKEMGYAENQIEFVEAKSPQRETMIQADQVKLIFATYSITDARKEKVSFAGPYFIAGQDLLVRTDDTSITGPDSLAGKKVCSVAGSTPAQNIKKEQPNLDLVEYDAYSLCVSALESGGVDAVTTDNVILAGYASQPQYTGKFKVVGKPFTTERYGVGLKKGDTATCTKVNEALTKMVSSGAWAKALDDTAGKSGFKPDDRNPPALEACS
ncbi:MAG: glutamate ABC transporter substrate-binding protein [Propioniciclava sp.]|uniref:glutamate ABC transporter substrate-binding protein n=1 Tax=Propioniciclava sp. TaxID=2038686 RepID=UPI0039E3AF25